MGDPDAIVYWFPVFDRWVLFLWFSLRLCIGHRLCNSSWYILGSNRTRKDCWGEVAETDRRGKPVATSLMSMVWRAHASA